MRSVPHPELLSILHAVEDAERQRVRVMRAQHRLVGRLLYAASPEELRLLTAEQGRLSDEFRFADNDLRERTEHLIAAASEICNARERT